MAPMAALAEELAGATGAADDPLVCSLRQHNLNDEPSFEAISYVWGSSQKTCTIICDGRPLAITKNLQTVLLQTRLLKQQRTLWADAICINQDDHREKGRQVAMMGRIYSEASRVLICLGPDESGHAEDIADLVSKVSQWILTTLESTDGSRDSFPYIASCEWPYSDRRWAILKFLTDQPWFGRGWVVQEAGLAKDAQILWGDTAIQWSELLRLYLWLFHRTTIDWATGDFLPVLHMNNYAAKHPIERMVFGHFNELTLLGTLHCGRALELQDERDHIYAFLGLAEAADARHGLEVDYDLSYLQIYFEFAIWYISTAQDLKLLHYVDQDDDALSADAAHTSLAVIQGSNLKVRGFLFDRILQTSKALDLKTTIEDIAEIWACFEEYTTDSVYRSAPPLLFFVFAIRLGSRMPGLGSGFSDAHVAAYMLRLLNGKPLPADPSVDCFRDALANHQGDATVAHNWVRVCLSGRRLVITARGYYGVVPAVSHEEDLCCIVFGTKEPFILRQTDREGHYNVLGDAFLTSARQEQGKCFNIGSGLGPYSNSDWLKWNLEEQDIYLC
ncbi:hypothetical protein VPNG_03510 [Cytospora leucostoma]|uniref:Heterokaryon incompatibility domain-containing protein n=1 Tax=Cytospora leucostoma TaxID=1230097 RepID=A0A423XCZ8_9PEZI|nr:hypothetical protein VPNG_03510 [Cytospora leucostoma]